MKKIIPAVLALGALAGCSSAADNASSNLSTQADNFQVERQIVFYNGITDKYIAEVTGLCSIGNDSTSSQVNYTCKTGPDSYIKNFLHISDNVTWFALQIAPNKVDPYHMQIILRPETLIPNVSVQTSGSH